MGLSLRRGLAALVVLGLGVGGSLAWPPRGGIAAQFGQQEVNPNNFIVVASPFGDNAHQLLILEQLNQVRPCWREQGINPVQVEPLLVNFDFTGICGRSSDSNGYSLRVAGQDLGWRYSLRIVKREGDLRLVGISTANRQWPELQIGRANGMTANFAKIVLEPGWRLTKRVYQGKTLGHIYLTHDRPIPGLGNTGGQPSPSSPTPNSPSPNSPSQSSPSVRFPHREAKPFRDAAGFTQPSPSSHNRRSTPSLLAKLQSNRRYPERDRHSQADYDWTAPPAHSSPETDHLSPFSGRRSQANRQFPRTGRRQGALARPPRKGIAHHPASSQSEVVVPIAVPPPETRAVRRPNRFPPPPAAGRSTGKSAGRLSAPLPPPPPPSRSSAPNLLPVPRASIPLGNGSAPPASIRRSRRGNSPPPPPSSLASALGYNYRLIVPTRNPRLQNKVRSIIPDAFRTRWNGREAMQAGLFVDRAEAEAVRQLLSSQGLKAKIFPVR